MNECLKVSSPPLLQARARFALERIRAHEQDRHKAEYARLVRRLPAMILRNGLGQGLAFCLATAGGKENRDQSPAGHLVQDLTEWLIGQRHVYPAGEGPELGRLIGELVKGNALTYQHAQQEALALLNWMKQFADAFLPKEDQT
jgi:CRISPR-associated protein Cmr5